MTVQALEAENIYFLVLHSKSLPISALSFRALAQYVVKFLIRLS